MRAFLFRLFYSLKVIFRIGSAGFNLKQVCCQATVYHTGDHPGVTAAGKVDDQGSAFILY